MEEASSQPACVLAEHSAKPLVCGTRNGSVAFRIPQGPALSPTLFPAASERPQRLRGGYGRRRRNAPCLKGHESRMHEVKCKTVVAPPSFPPGHLFPRGYRLIFSAEAGAGPGVVGPRATFSDQRESR